jgi:hypothetical protein
LRFRDDHAANRLGSIHPNIVIRANSRAKAAGVANSLLSVRSRLLPHAETTPPEAREIACSGRGRAPALPPKVPRR